MSTVKSATNRSFGANPKLYPRPQYPTIFYVIKSMMRDIVWQAGIQGAVIAMLIYPLYQKSRDLAKSYELSDAMYFSIITSLSHTFMYCFVNAFFMSYDYFGLYQKYKLTRKPFMKPKAKLLRKMFTEALISQLITGPPLAYFLYPLFVKFGMYNFDAPLPSFKECAITFMIGHVFNDFGFYLTHRLMHSKPLYKTFHKQHHEFTGTIGFAAEYAGPVEVVVSNQIPTLGGVLFFGCHPLCVWIWLCLRLQQTYEAHSGYCFEGHWTDYVGLSHPESAAFHDHHHTSNQGNFGSLYTDYIFGTMDHWMSLGGQEGYVNKKMKNTKKSE
jgi:sterol desaturase/sphingolipid hydroxylase (fatty acid hydroxylase superfamily)